MAVKRITGFGLEIIQLQGYDRYKPDRTVSVRI